MVDDLPSILERMNSINFAVNHYPLLGNNFLKDQDVLVHSIGCSVWNTLGHEIGYMAIVECPAPGTYGADIRSDSGWFVKTQTVPFCLVEFERYDGTSKGQAKLAEKLKNLLEAAQRWDGSPEILILSAWSQGIVGAPDTLQLKRICTEGFVTKTGESIRPGFGVNIVFNRFLFKTQENGALQLVQMRCEILL